MSDHTTSAPLTREVHAKMVDMDAIEALARCIDNIDTTGAVWEDDQFGQHQVIEAATSVVGRLTKLGWKIVPAGAPDD